MKPGFFAQEKFSQFLQHMFYGLIRYNIFRKFGKGAI